uniref:Uncharacterized protein n=1 Tax=Panagrolaimus davidi TaxID=227884 RepID=A0A914PNQ8_9BILA
MIEAANGNISTARDSQYQQQHHQYQDYNNQISSSSNYAPLQNKKITKKKKPAHYDHNSYSRPQSSYTYGDLTEIYSVDQGNRDMPEIATSDFGNYDIYRHPQNDDDEHYQQYNNIDEEYDGVPWGNLEDINEKDKHMLNKHRQ